MRKQEGFSLLELMVAIGIVVLLGVAAATNFSRPNNKVAFEKEVQAIFDTITTARTNSLTNKKCDDDAPESWSTYIGTSDFSLRCNDTEIKTSPIEHHSHIIEFNDDPDDTNVSVRIQFSPERNITRIFSDADLKSSVRIVFENAQTGNSKTLCFHGSAGFPELLDNNVPCS